MNRAAPVIAILSDIHGNIQALRAVLGELEGESYDELVVAGDIVVRGLHEAECIDLLRELGCAAVMGNSDIWAATSDAPEAVEIRERIGPERIHFLASLPREHRVTPPGGESPNDDLLIVHATPQEIGTLILFERNPLYQNPLTPVAEARRLLGGARANLIVGGHVHFKQRGVIDRQGFATISPVSFSVDGDPRAGYALATWDGADWNLEHRRVAYDVEAVADEIERSGLAKANEWAESLRTGFMEELFSRYSG
ncbi:MAG: metallophosphoesterase [Chloroflexi bacterium]|nr:metallophosphoesterase [Chloroflexota bacterium]MCY3937931.1 metallophosphoesterase [Chloroflexota bacterium]